MTLNFIAFTELLIVFSLVTSVLFIRTQYLTLKRIRPEIRKIEPGLVWLQLIPTLNIIMAFVIVNGISKSLADCLIENGPDSGIDGGEYSVANLDPKPTFTTGISYCVFVCAATISSLFMWNPVMRVDYLMPGFFLVGVFFWIVYWIDLSRYSKKLKNGDIV